MTTTTERKIITPEREPAGFGRSLRALRLQRGLSQTQLARDAGFDHSYVSRLESGDRAPSREAVMRLAHELGLTPDQRDELLFAGGFVPTDPTALLADEPVLREVYQALNDPSLASRFKHLIRRDLFTTMSWVAHIRFEMNENGARDQ